MGDVVEIEKVYFVDSKRWEVTITKVSEEKNFRNQFTYSVRYNEDNDTEDNIYECQIMRKIR